MKVLLSLEYETLLCHTINKNEPLKEKGSYFFCGRREACHQKWFE